MFNISASTILALFKHLVQTFGDAKSACPGYIDDLKSEGALGIKVVIKCCRPDVLTNSDE
ncbi:DUF1816 domain-containing protein [Nostoc sp.]|uniref:DUF1816 domain-containing protein n=1 Tax=Nostoc sp. TaxID=1180 RepID=UPI003FA5AA41